MLTCEIRTMDLSKIIELWEADKETLADKLLEDYKILVSKYRELQKEWNQKSHIHAKITNKYHTFDRINYKKELGINEKLSGNIRFTNDLVENIKISQEYIEAQRLYISASNSLQLKEIVRLKAREIEGLLKLLDVKVNYVEDFEKYNDDWLREDLYDVEENWL